MNLNLFRRKPTKQYGLEDLYGTYLGFSPTDESPIAMGELEVTISESTIKFRMATGLKIHSEEGPNALVPMTEEEIAAAYLAGSSYAKKTVGFKNEGLQFLFLPKTNEGDLGLIIRGLLGDILGPTLMFSPKQIQEGLYQKALDEIEKNAGPNMIPLLKYNGQTSL